MKRTHSTDTLTLDTSTDMRREQPRQHSNNGRSSGGGGGASGNGGGSGAVAGTGNRSTCPMLGNVQNTISCNPHEQTLVIKFKNKLNHTIRTTYMLVLLSKWFIIFHVPYFVCWAIYHIYMNKWGQLDALDDQHQSSPPSPLSTAIFSGVTNDVNSSAQTSSSSSFSNFYSQQNTITATSTSQLDPNTILTLRALVNLFEILFLFNYTVHFFLYLFNIPSFKRAHANEVRRFLRQFGLCAKTNRRP